MTTQTFSEVDISSLIGAATTQNDDDSTIIPPTIRPPMTSFDSNLSTTYDTEYNLSSSNNRKRRKRITKWWTSVISRVSRSASSLLNQHSPNLNELLEENVNVVDDGDDYDEGRCRGVDGVYSNEKILNGNSQEVYELQEQVERLKGQICLLEDRLEQQQQFMDAAQNNQPNINSTSAPPQESIQDIPTLTNQPLQPHQIARYSRQLLLSDGFGVEGQQKLLSSSILVVGAGGIGSSLLLYLAATGVGHITIVDFDTVEMTNLHRQIIHRDDGAANINRGRNKAHSAKEAMRGLNPTISVTPLDLVIDHTNIMELVSKHDVVVDASDNPTTRYLLNDACILGHRPLVSGSAMGTEGQLTVYNYSTVNGGKSACYRCLYPNPNPVEGCKSCSDNGVLGMVPGLIGVLQAVEVVKILTGIGKVMHDRLLMYDSLPCSFINIKKPPPKPNCAICSSQPTIKSINDSHASLQNTRGPSVCTIPTQNTLSPNQRISCQDYHTLRQQGHPHILLDVRVTRQYEMCCLPGSINIPLEQIPSKLNEIESLSNNTLPVYCMCRRGVASVEATRILQSYIDGGNDRIHSVFNVDGGLNEWVRSVDGDFPRY